MRGAVVTFGKYKGKPVSVLANNTPLETNNTTRVAIVV